MQVAARAMAGLGATFELIQIERRPLGATDVLIDIHFAGICHTDISHARSEWGPTIFPLVPGHEIAGVVAAVGKDITQFAIGDRVGVGVMVDSCGRCDPCLTGTEQHCTEHFVRTYNWQDAGGDPTYGGYSERIVVTSRFVVKIPEALHLAAAAPLMCAGITVFSPMRRWGVGAGSRVGIVGLGGLGHIAVQVAKALGAEVTVFDRDPGKEADSRKFGAAHFSVVSNAVPTGLGPFDVILSTVPASVAVGRYAEMLAVNGAFVSVGVPDQPISIDPFVLMKNNRSISGSSIGGIAETQEMLEFCAQHGIEASIEVIDADEIQSAYDRLHRSDVRYRFVIDGSTIAGPAEVASTLTTEQESD